MLNLKYAKRNIYLFVLKNLGVIYKNIPSNTITKFTCVLSRGSGSGSWYLTPLSMIFTFKKNIYVKTYKERNAPTYSWNSCRSEGMR